MGCTPSKDRKGKDFDSLGRVARGGRRQKTKRSKSANDSFAEVSTSASATNSNNIAKGKKRQILSKQFQGATTSILVKKEKQPRPDRKVEFEETQERKRRRKKRKNSKSEKSISSPSAKQQEEDVLSSISSQREEDDPCSERSFKEDEPVRALRASLSGRDFIVETDRTQTARVMQWLQHTEKQPNFVEASSGMSFEQTSELSSSGFANLSPSPLRNPLEPTSSQGNSDAHLEAMLRHEGQRGEGRDSDLASHSSRSSNASEWMYDLENLNKEFEQREKMKQEQRKRKAKSSSHFLSGSASKGDTLSTCFTSLNQSSVTAVVSSQEKPSL